MIVTNYPVITADEGMMLFNGKAYSKKVYVGTADRVENWREVPMSEYEQWLKENQPEEIEENETSL